MRTVRAAIIAAVSVIAFQAAAPAEDAVVVTPSRFPERALDAPIGMTVITAAEIARDTSRTLPELLSRLGAMYSRDNSGSPDKQIDLRGFGITGDQNTLVLLDGVRLNENDLSSTKLSAIPLQSIERIEILRGGDAVMYGGGTTGGTVNIITRGPQAGRKDAQVFAGFGSYGSLDTRASVNIAGERFGALFSGSHFESDNYRDNNRVRQDNLTGDVRYTGADGGVGVKFGSDWQRLQLPGQRDENQLRTDPRGAANRADWSTRDGNYVTLTGQRRLGDVELLSDLAYRDQTTTANFQSLSSYSDTRLSNTAFSPRLKWSVAPFGMPSNLVAGTDWGSWEYNRRIAGSPSAIAVPFSTTRGTQDTSGYYFQYNAQLTDAARVSAGARRHRVQDELIQTGFASTTQRQLRALRAGELGLQYALSPNWTVFGRLATSFRVATVDDNGFTATGNLLEPQTARHREAGVEYRRSGLRLRANAYLIDLNNEIYFSPIVVPFGANTNLSPTERTGFELFGSATLSPQFEFSGNLTYQTATFKYGVYGGVDVAGKDVPLVPEALVNLRAAWSFTPQTRLYASATYVGAQRYDNDQANTFQSRMPTYALVDLKLSHMVEGWNLSAAINNLFDKRYYSYGIVNSFACATPICAYPQAGITAFASAEYAFK